MLKLIVNLLFSVSSLVLCSILFLFSYGFYLSRSAPALLNSKLILTGDYTIQDDPDFGFIPTRKAVTFRSEPGTNVRFHLYTDSRSARVNQPGDETPSSVDIMAVGCSSTWGHGIESNQTYIQRIGAALRVSVANFGFGSYGSVGSLLMLKRNLDLRPKIVLYGFIEDHLRRNIVPCAYTHSPYCLSNPYIAFTKNQEPYIQLPSANRVPVSAHRRFYLASAAEGGSGYLDLAMWKLQSIMMQYRNVRLGSPSETEDSIPRRAAALKFTISEMEKLARSSGFKLIVLYLPGPQLSPDPPVELTEAVSADTEILNISGYVAKKVEGETTPAFIPRDGHPSAFGHQLMSEAIVRLLQSRYKPYLE